MRFYLSHWERSAKAKPEAGEDFNFPHPKSSASISTSPGGRGILCALLLLAAPALAAEHYTCPDLHNPAKQKIAPMTQGKDGWFFRGGDFIEYYELLPATQEYLTRLNSAFAANGAQLVMLQVPPRTLSLPQFIDNTQPMQNRFNRELAETNYRAYTASLKKTGATVVEILDDSGVQDAETGLHYYFKRDTHWTPYGAKITAQNVAKALGLKPAKYTTKVTGKNQMKGAIAQELQNLCSDTLPPEPYPQYSTALAEVSGEAALFGDESGEPPLILLGSSFSALDEFNLSGFLSETTGLEVANFAMSAGQLYNAILSYASLPQDQKLAPKYVVWENLAHYDFNRGERMFRQLIPAVQGECSEADALATGTLEVKDGKGGTLVKLDEKATISGSKHYLFISTENLGLSRFTLELDYANDDGEWFAIDRSQYFNNTGRFFVELTDEITASLTRVRLINPSVQQAKVSLRVCKLPETAKKGV